MKPVLKVQKLVKRYDSFVAVGGINFEVNPGQVLGIIGPNGAAKTTTVKTILGLLIADSGNVKILDGDITDPKIRAQIGYMPETPSFYHHLSGFELLVFVGKLFDLPKDEVKKRALDLLEKVGLSKASNRKIGTYSKGMLQRICLAQALINQPKLLFLDEPLDGLDPLGRIRMKEILLDIKSKGTAIVLNSHILSDVEIMSDIIAIMDQGKILKLSSVKDLVPKNKTLEEVFLELVENNPVEE